MANKLVSYWFVEAWRAHFIWLAHTFRPSRHTDFGEEGKMME